MTSIIVNIRTVTTSSDKEAFMRSVASGKGGYLVVTGRTVNRVADTIRVTPGVAG
ncbi:MAG: hypothetical protein OXF02_00800 [Simkaniaceae bacterium]|nr:hypothetical protein [Simkaniaceae bacterium]